VQVKLIGLGNELCGITFKVKVPDLPAAVVVLVGLEVNVKSTALTWKLWLTGVVAA
jgi:hypothetical protein